MLILARRHPHGIQTHEHPTLAPPASVAAIRTTPDPRLLPTAVVVVVVAAEAVSATEAALLPITPVPTITDPTVGVAAADPTQKTLVRHRHHMHHTMRRHLASELLLLLLQELEMGMCKMPRHHVCMGTLLARAAGAGAAIGGLMRRRRLAECRRRRLPLRRLLLLGMMTMMIILGTSEWLKCVEVWLGCECRIFSFSFFFFSENIEACHPCIL